MTWKKLLYLKQPYPDNFTDSSFLGQLKRNSTVTRYSFYTLAYDFHLINFHLYIITLQYIVFIGFFKHNWDPIFPVVIVPSAIVALPLFKSRNSITVIMFTILTLSPVLKSLSSATSSDTIWALSTWLCIAHLIFNDYGMSPDKYNPVIPTNIMFGNIILLASRLESAMSVCSFIVISIDINVLVPYYDRWLRSRGYMYLHWLLLGFLGTVTNLCLPKMLLLPAILVQLAVQVALPIVYLYLQQYKNEMQGPWDPAKPLLAVQK